MAKVIITIPGGTGSAEIPHNELDGLQGGALNEYYHLTLEEYTNLPSILDIPTLTSELTNDGEDGINPFITLNDLPAPLGLQGTLEAGSEAYFDGGMAIYSTTGDSGSEFAPNFLYLYDYDSGSNESTMTANNIAIHDDTYSINITPLGFTYGDGVGFRSIQFQPQSNTAGKILFQDVTGSNDEILAFLSDIPTPAGLQDLDSVLNEGNTSSISINITDGTTTASIYESSVEVTDLLGNFAILQLGNIVVGNTTLSSSLEAGALALTNGATASVSRIKNTNVTNTDITLEIPNKLTGSYTIATLDDITSPTTILATSIVDGDTTHAPNGNAVFDALALKLDTSVTGFDATKIADGSVNNTEFQYINSLTSNVQTQLNTNASNITNNTNAIAAIASRYIYQGYTTITGVTGVQVLASLLIPANTYSSTDAFEIIVNGQKSTTANAIIYGIYHSTTLNGTTNGISTAANLSNVNRGGSIQRILSLDSGLARNNQQANAAGMTPFVSSSGIGGNFTFNPAIDNYITVTVNPTVITEVVEVTSIIIRPLK